MTETEIMRATLEQLAARTHDGTNRHIDCAACLAKNALARAAIAKAVT